MGPGPGGIVTPLRAADFGMSSVAGLPAAMPAPLWLGCRRDRRPQTRARVAKR